MNPSLAARALGWRPEVALASGLQETLSFFDARWDSRRNTSKKSNMLERQF